MSAPSGLTLGGGFEVLVQSNFVASHTNLVIGLVETIVGLVPAGGGCKEMLWRWSQTEEAKSDPDYAPLKVFDIGVPLFCAVPFTKKTTSLLSKSASTPIISLFPNPEP